MTITENSVKMQAMIALRKDIKVYKSLMTRYKCAMMEVETKFKVLNEEFSLKHDRNPIESIKSRLKSPESIYDKVERRCFEPTVASIEENMTDIAGVRVVCSFKEDIYVLARCLLSQDDVKLIMKKDYIENPKPNGYRSLHLIIEVPIFLQNEKQYVKVEVQLRTIAMDFWASLEHHVKYKKDISKELEEEIAQELKECATASAILDEKMEQIKNKIK